MTRKKKRAVNPVPSPKSLHTNRASAKSKLQMKSSAPNLVAWVFFGLFALLFMLSPYQRGLFFHSDFFSVGMSIQVLFLLSLSLMFSVVRELVREQWPIFVVLFAIPFVYMLSFWYSYLPSTASYEALQWFSYALSFFLLLVWMKGEERIREALWLLAWATMIWIAGLVFLVHFGVLEFQDAILGGRRFSSVFQYPNTFAALLSVFVLVSLQHLTKRLSWFYTSLYAFTLFPFFLAFLLTQSRGALLVFAAAWVLALYFLSWREQVLYVLYSAVLVGISFWGYSRYTDGMQEEMVGSSVALLLGVTVVLGVMLLAAQHWLVRSRGLARKSKWDFLVPILFTVTGALAVFLAGTTLRDKVVAFFPEGLQRRVASISLDEAYSRLLFFKDALTVWRDHFFFGAGGGGWRALFESYKSLPYYSTQAHSFYMQTLVEVGLVGSLLIFGFLFYVLAKGVWYYFRRLKTKESSQLTDDTHLDKSSIAEGTLLSSAIMAALILLLHSAIDFNMSFGTYNLFLFLFLALIWHDVQEEPWLRTRLALLFQRMEEKLSIKYKAMASYSFLGVLVVASIFTAYTSYAYSQAEQVPRLLSQGRELPVLLEQLDKAIAYNAHDVRFKQMKVNLLGQAYQQTGDSSWLEQMKQLYAEIVEKEPTIYQHYLQYAQFLWDIEEKDQAMHMKLEALAVAPWQQGIYEDVLASGLAYLRELEHVHADEQKEILIEQLNQVMEQYEARMVVQVEEAPEGFRPSNRLRRQYDLQLTMAELYLSQEQYTHALEALQEFLSESQQEQEWFMDMFVNGEVGGEVKPFELQTLRADLERYLEEGHVIIMAGRDRVARRLSHPVKELLAQTGSNIAQLGNQDSYIGVMVDGQMVVEQIDGTKPLEITNVTHPELSAALGNETFYFYSAGHKLGEEDKASIIWRDKERSRNGRGLNIVVLDKDLKVIDRIHYNTHVWDYKIVLKD